MAVAGNLHITQQQFQEAITRSGFHAPPAAKYTGFINGLSMSGGAISSKRELAMFLANIIQESGGLQFVREQNYGPNDYRRNDDYPGQHYYGRGYIQLTWVYNYRAASKALFNDDRLVKDADQVADNEDIAWATAFWFWKENVHSAPGVQAGNFRATIQKINSVELSSFPAKVANRERYYECVKAAFGVAG